MTKYEAKIDFAQLKELIEAADEFHEEATAHEGVADTPAWTRLGEILDKVMPVPFYRNTGEPR